MRVGIFQLFVLTGIGLSAAGCSMLPPGSDYPKKASVTSVAPEATRFGRQFERAAREHGGLSGFRIIPVGIDGFLMRIELINAAERTLDLQYYIFRGDETGQLLTDALARAADRGVRIRLLMDDGETEPGDEQVLALSRHANIEIRLFNPWAYRGHSRVLRDAEYLLHHSRLDYRMHDKLLVADNAIALIGGRNVGDQYFQIDPESQFADDDLFAAGPMVPKLSAKFDEFWNSTLSVPAEALARHVRSRLAPMRRRSAKPVSTTRESWPGGEPLADVLSGKAPLFWANALLASDSPEKKRVQAGQRVGSLMYEPVANAIAHVRRELLLVTPYFIPTKAELGLLEGLRARGARVAVLTNSLESAPDVAAHSGYMHYRKPLLKKGVELYEVRSQPDSARGSGQSAGMVKYGNYALHGKLIVLDDSRVYIGSMNFDQRSRRLNTEIGLIIDSPELAQQVQARFRAMTRPESSYSVQLRPNPATAHSRLIWRTRQAGSDVELADEPARSRWQTLKVNTLKLLPLDPEL